MTAMPQAAERAIVLALLQLAGLAVVTVAIFVLAVSGSSVGHPGSTRAGHVADQQAGPSRH